MNSDLRDFFRVGQRTAYEARLMVDFRLQQGRYIFVRWWRAVWIGKDSGLPAKTRPKTPKMLDEWIKMLENELEYVDETDGSSSPTSSVISGNGFWHDEW